MADGKKRRCAICGGGDERGRSVGCVYLCGDCARINARLFPPKVGGAVDPAWTTDENPWQQNAVRALEDRHDG